MPANNPVKAVQRTFFDRPKVIAAIGRKNAAVLARTGAFVRTVMKRGMRRRSGVSLPGGYPHAHSNPLLKELIFFGFDESKKTVVIGPVLLSPDTSVVVGEKKVTKLVNEGGLIVRQKRSRGRVVVTRRLAQYYRPRPFVALTAPHAAKALADNMEKIGLK